MRPITKRLEAQDAVVLLSALAQPTRLAAFRLLMRYRPHGLSAGHIARLLAVPQNTLSSHLALLERAGLVASRRESRNMIYAAAAYCADALLGSDWKDRRITWSRGVAVAGQPGAIAREVLVRA